MMMIIEYDNNNNNFDDDGTNNNERLEERQWISRVSRFHPQKIKKRKFLFICQHIKQFSSKNVNELCLHSCTDSIRSNHYTIRAAFH